MKKFLLPLCVLAIVLLAACRPAEDGPPPEEGPIELEALSVEIPRGDLPAQDLAQAVRELPEALREALAEQGVEVETVTVSVGTSPSATAQAVMEDGVDLAFFAAEDYAALEEPPQILLTAGDGEKEPGAMTAAVSPDNETLTDGTFAGALAAAVNSLAPENTVFGPYEYAPAAEG